MRRVVGFVFILLGIGACEAPLSNPGQVSPGVPPPAMVGVQPPPVTPPPDGVPAAPAPTLPVPPAAMEKPIYDDTRVMEVELTLAPSDFELVRGEGRSFADVISGCEDPNFEYTLVPTRARVDGEEFPNIGVRKRGFLGSLSQSKPSLKLDFDAYEKLEFRGQKSLALANSNQDPSLMHMCLAYTVFASAGLPTPRCSFAHVVVNGEELGYYINIEPIKKPMLRRFFPDVSGNLYEGTGGADFVAGAALTKFERKNDDADPSQKPELTALAGALVNTGAAMLSAVEPLVDLDEFMRFWAIETIVGHWDGYTGGLNNYYLYARPEDGKLRFIPWGTDATFASFHPFLPFDIMRPPATYARGRLATRLYEYAPTLDRYRAVLGEMLAAHWNEAALHARLDAWSNLLGAAVDPEALSEVRDFIDGRRADVRRELDATPVAWTIPERTLATCQNVPKIPITGTFDTTWGSDPETPSATPPSPMNRLEFMLDGAPQRFDAVRASIGAPFPEEPPVLYVVGTRMSGDYVFVLFSLPDRMLTAGSKVTLQGTEYGEVYRGNEMMDTGSPVGYITKGTITFDEIGTTDGMRVRGHFEGQLSPYQERTSETSP